jgi:CCR4-NOT transcription complex subunit 6
LSLRELLLNNNFLRVLPYELGKLFKLQVLGLKGNPLTKDIMSLYMEPNGTHKLLTYMMDNLQGRKPDIFCNYFFFQNTKLLRIIYSYSK